MDKITHPHKLLSLTRISTLKVVESTTRTTQVFVAKYHKILLRLLSPITMYRLPPERRAGKEQTYSAWSHDQLLLTQDKSPGLCMKYVRRTGAKAPLDIYEILNEYL